MKYRCIIIALLICFAYLVSCKFEHQKTENKNIFIPLTEKKVLSIYDIFEDVQFIPLETNDFSLLTDMTNPNFSKVLLKNGYIYTQHLNSARYV